MNSEGFGTEQEQHLLPCSAQYGSYESAYAAGAEYRVPHPTKLAHNASNRLKNDR